MNVSIWDIMWRACDSWGRSTWPLHIHHKVCYTCTYMLGRFYRMYPTLLRSLLFILMLLRLLLAYINTRLLSRDQGPILSPRGYHHEESLSVAAVDQINHGQGKTTIFLCYHARRWFWNGSLAANGRWSILLCEPWRFWMRWAEEDDKEAGWLKPNFLINPERTESVHGTWFAKHALEGKVPILLLSLVAFYLFVRSFLKRPKPVNRWVRIWRGGFDTRNWTIVRVSW